MAVVAASLMTVRPGAYEAFLEQHKKVKPALERAGARNIRLMGTLGGPGDAGGAPAVSFEFDDYASYGKFRTGCWPIPKRWRYSSRSVPTKARLPRSSNRSGASSTSDRHSRKAVASWGSTFGSAPDSRRAALAALSTTVRPPSGCRRPISPVDVRDRGPAARRGRRSDRSGCAGVSVRGSSDFEVPADLGLQPGTDCRSRRVRPGRWRAK